MTKSDTEAMLSSRNGRGFRLAGVLLGVFAHVLACGDEEGDEGPQEGDERYACVFESSLMDSCNNPMGSPWTEGCVDVLTDDDCGMATAEKVEELGDCTFTTTYRNVMTTPGIVCPQPETTGPVEADAAPVGEACSSLDDCASGLCVPRFYCTVSCSADSDCSEDFPGGCCVGEGSLGYCIAESDCAGLCPANSTPFGLPTICLCDDGFVYDPTSGECMPA
jgi:hypothetical protein